MISYTVLYPLVLAVSRWLLPLLSLWMVWLWIVRFRGIKPGNPTLARFVTRQGEATAIRTAEAMIGRKKKCDVVLNYPSIEPNHALLFRQKEQWLLSPLQGEVFLNEKPLETTAPLLEGDVVAFGEEEFIFEGNLPRGEEISSSRPKNGGLLLVALTLFQLVMAGQLCLRFSANLTPFLPLSFGALLVGEWIYYFIKKIGGTPLLLWEVPVLYLTTLGFGVCACSVPFNLPKQLLCAGVGVVGSLVLTLLLRHPGLCHALQVPIGLICLGVLWFTVFFGTRIYGSVNWLSLGGISFQPSEFAKIAFLTVGSCSLPILAQKPLNRWLFLLFAGLTMGALVCMVDFGAIAIFFVTMLILLSMRLTDWRLITGILLCAVAAGIVAVLLFPHIATRFEAWLHVWDYADSSGYQQTRTLIAIASGGLLGVGGGNGTLISVAAADTDLVFGILCEEWGQIVGLCAALCFVALALTARKLAQTTKSAFHAMGVCAAAGMMVFQTALNIFGSTDLLPLTGVTMMFVSRGGTSLLAAFLLTAFWGAAQATPQPIPVERREYP